MNEVQLLRKEIIKESEKKKHYIDERIKTSLSSIAQRKTMA